MAKWYATKRATTVIEEDGFHKCIYHQTAVVSWNDNKIILDSGGYLTATTKKRMNEVSHIYKLDFRIYQENNEWFVWRRPYEPIPFEDGLMLTRSKMSRLWHVI